MVITSAQLISIIGEWLLPFFRIAGLLMVAPVIGTRSVPTRIRLIIALAITMVIVPVIPVSKSVDLLSLESFFTVLDQVLIGVAMGLSLRVVFVVVELAGQAIGQLMGLMLASMVDPQNGNQVPIVGQLYLLLSTLLFLSIDGHLVMIKGLADSFFLLPTDAGGISRDMLWNFVNWTSIVFTTSVLIALPAMVSMLIVNLGFGVMTRAAPQLNIFAVGFPVMIIIGIMVIMFTLDGFVPHMVQLFEAAGDMMLQLLVVR